MSSLDIQIVDERRLTIPTGRLTPEQTKQVGTFITDAAEHGYALVSTQVKQTSNMRGEKYTDGYILTFRKP